MADQYLRNSFWNSANNLCKKNPLQYFIPTHEKQITIENMKKYDAIKIGNILPNISTLKNITHLKKIIFISRVSMLYTIENYIIDFLRNLPNIEHFVLICPNIDCHEIIFNIPSNIKKFDFLNNDITNLKNLSASTCEFTLILSNDTIKDKFSNCKNKNIKIMDPMDYFKLYKICVEAF